MEEIKNIFFSSDLRGYHKNNCYSVSDWEDKEQTTRTFNAINKMNYAIVKAINDVVGEDDVLYFLGDWSFGGIENIWNVRKQIFCKNIHIIYGNHDHHMVKNKQLPNCHWDLTTGEFIVDGPNPNVFGDDGDRYFDVHAHDLFTSVGELKIITIEKQEIVLCHYPIEEWTNIDKGTWMLYGHVHSHSQKPKSKYKTMDISLDASGFKILSFDDIKKIMDRMTS